MTHLGEVLGLIWVECSSHGCACRVRGEYMGIKKREEEEESTVF